VAANNIIQLPQSQISYITHCTLPISLHIHLLSTVMKNWELTVIESSDIVWILHMMFIAAPPPLLLLSFWLNKPVLLSYPRLGSVPKESLGRCCSRFWRLDALAITQPPISKHWLLCVAQGAEVSVVGQCHVCNVCIADLLKLGSSWPEKNLIDGLIRK